MRLINPSPEKSLPIRTLLESKIKGHKKQSCFAKYKPITLTITNNVDLNKAENPTKCEVLFTGYNVALILNFVCFSMVLVWLW